MEFIDHYYYKYVMEEENTNPDNQTSNLAKRKKNVAYTNNLNTIDIQVSVLECINKRLDVLGMLHQEIKDLRKNLEFTHQQIGRETILNSNTLSSFLDGCNTKRKENTEGDSPQHTNQKYVQQSHFFWNP